MTFLAEWGDRSQIATIILGAREVGISQGFSILVCLGQGVAPSLLLKIEEKLWLVTYTFLESGVGERVVYDITHLNGRKVQIHVWIAI